MNPNPRQLLLVRSSQPENVYGPFTQEILKSEGLNGFEVLDIDTAGFPSLAEGDIAIVTRCFLRNAEMDQLRQGLEAGARVICFQPGWTLAGRFGWESTRKVSYPGWIRIHDGNPGTGVPIQTHVPVATYRTKDTDWVTWADTVFADWSDGGSPAVAGKKVGKGQIVFFFYDLPRAVAAIRFGNPELASVLTSGLWGWPHASDLFFGHTDPRVIHLPQADFHGQLLAKVLTDISPYPLPRFWYYPQWQQRSMAVFQSDDDMSTPEQFQELSDSLLRHGGTGTFYLMKQTLLSNDQVAEFRSKGHTFAPHVFGVDGVEELYYRFPEAMAEETRLFKERFGTCSVSLQCHYAPWMGYMSWVPEFLRYGFRLLFAYFSIPVENLNKYLCGSGRAMRFYDQDGTLYNCRQQPLLTYDDSSIRKQVETDPRRYVKGFESSLMSAVERTHTAVGILSHPVSFSTYSRPFIEACFDLLVREGVPIYNGDQWSDFMEYREAVRIKHFPRDAGGITCVVSNLAGPLPLMVPVEKGKTLSVRVDGVGLDGKIQRRLEQDYIVIPLEGKSGGEVRIDIG